MSARQALVLFATYVAVAGGWGSVPLCGQQAAWPGAAVVQQNGGVMNMPLDRPWSRRNGLSLSVDTRWANGYGYRPIEFSVQSSKPSTKDQIISIRLYTHWNNRFNIEHSFLLPKGSTTASTTIACPQFRSSYYNYFWWDVWIDGIRDNDLSLDRGTNSSANVHSGRAGSRLSMLAVAPVGGTRALTAPSSEQFDVLSLAFSEFPRRWIEYTCFDLVAVSIDQLVTLSQSHPAALEAMLRWVRTGGQLWVNDVGTDLDRLAELSKLLGVSHAVDPAVSPGADDTDNDAAARVPGAGWGAVRLQGDQLSGEGTIFIDSTTGERRTVSDPDEIRLLQSDSNFVLMGQYADPADGAAQGSANVDSGQWFVAHPYGLGAVRAFRGASELAGLSGQKELVAGGSTSMPAQLVTAVGTTRQWTSRHGLAPDEANLDFVNLLVPGVGQAPVTEFRVLITLFVLLIGPVNYWLLKRWGRLQLLVLTVPAAAAALTAMLFAYAVVSDGFGTKVRAASFTTLDQRSGEAACWTRLSYYSGLAPAQGLTMPADVVLYPIIPGWNAGDVEAVVGRPRDMVWHPDQVQLTRGWLRSRTPTQYLTLRARSTPSRVELLSGGGKLRATNQLGTAVEFILVSDDVGRLWHGEDLADGAVEFLAPIERAEAGRRLRERISANEPRVPLELVDVDSHFAALQRRARRQYSDREVRLTQNLPSDALASLAGHGGRPSLELPPRSYVAFTVTGPEVEFGLRGAKEVDSFHVVMGQW